MVIRSIFVASIFLGSISCLSANFSSFDQDVYVISLERIENDTKIGRSIKDKVEKYMLSIKKQIEVLENYSDSSSKDLDALSANMGKDLDEYDFNLEQFKHATDKNRHLMLYSLAQKKSNKVNQVTRAVVLNMQSFIKDKISLVAKRRKAKVILDRSSLLYGESIIDITEDVIDEIDKNYRQFVFPQELNRF